MKSESKILCYIVAAILSCGLLESCSTTTHGPLQGISAIRAQPADAIRVPLVTYFRGLKSVNVTIGATEHSFLVDSGGGRTLLTPETAASLGCKPTGRDVGYRMNGEPVVFQNCTQLKASLGSYEFQVAPVAVFDLNSLLPSELPRLDGVLALDTFRGQVITLDWASDSLTIHSSADTADAIRSHGAPARFATGENGAALSVLLPVQGARARMWFLLDSGNIKGNLIARHVSQDGSVQIASNAVAQLRVGDRDEEALPVIPDDINFDGVLGTNYLQTHVLTLDLRSSPGA